MTSFIVYPKSGERGTRIKDVPTDRPDREIADIIASGCKRFGWLSTQVDIYRQTPGGWTEPWGEMDIVSGEFRRRS